jgi:hypothetical protein
MSDHHISLTDMRKAKDSHFSNYDWLCKRNTVEFLGLWETVYNPDFNSGEFAIIGSQEGLNNYKLSVKQWVKKTNDIRRALVEADLVDTALRDSAFHQSKSTPQVLSEAKSNMVALPGQLFYSTQIPVCLWFIGKNGNAGGSTFGLN